MPQKKYIVRLTAQEREICQQTVRKLNGSSEKVRRAQILLKADADGPGWTDQQIAYAISCRTKTVENIRERCVLEGFERALERKRRALPQGLKLLDGEQEAQVIALRLGSPPKGYANWSLRLLARRVVEFVNGRRKVTYSRQPSVRSSPASDLFLVIDGEEDAGCGRCGKPRSSRFSKLPVGALFASMGSVGVHGPGVGRQRCVRVA